MNRIDIDREIEAMADYAGQRWLSIKNIRDVVQHIANLSIKDNAHTFSSSDFSLAMLNLQKARVKALESSESGKNRQALVRYYDANVSLLDQLGSNAFYSERAILHDWSYDDQCKKALKSVLKEFSDLARKAPDNWPLIVAHYEKYSSDSYLWEENRKSYMGIQESLGISPHFVERLADPELVNQVKNNGRSPIYAFVSAVYGYTSQLKSLNNTKEMIDEVKSLIERQPALCFETSRDFKNDILRTMASLELPVAYSPEDFERAVTSADSFDALSESERNAIRAENMKEMSDWLDIRDIDAQNDARRERIFAGFAHLKAGCKSRGKAHDQGLAL